MRAILRARLAIDSLHGVSADTGIVVDDGNISDVGKYHEIACQANNTPVHDLDGIVCPALVNAHTHLELSAYHKDGLPHKDFVDWVLQLVEARSSPSSVDAHLECSKVKMEAQARGTAYFVNVGNDFELNSSLGQNQLFQFEQIGINNLNADRIFERARSLVRGGNAPDIALAIHAAYSVSPELMKKIKMYNNSRSVITSIHLAETSDEVEFTRSGRGRIADLLDRRVGKWDFSVPELSPVEYVDTLGILDAMTICAHCVFVDDHDIELMRNRGSAVAICVRSNEELSGEVPPVKKFLQNGIKILLGTDSTASSPDIDMFSELAAFYSRFHDLLSPDAVFKMATSTPAGLLGIGNYSGNIVAGDRASLVHVPYDGRVEDAFEFLVSQAHGNTRAVEI